ncbi:uncharacterized protein LOC118436650 [Folsomia candida]|nr:uncharacterized protein LOC118436650 [Folsomia candida]XP_035711041.1 uncharacterized protein LOC118436650 [Folsomia candida]
MVQFQLVFNNLFLEDIKDEEVDAAEICSAVSTHKTPNPDMEEDDDDDEIPPEKEKTSIAIAFDKGTISHPHPSLRSNPKIQVCMKGAILLSLKLGEYPKMASYDGSKLDAILKNMALEYFVVENESSLRHLSLYPSSQFFIVAPTLQPWSKKSELFIKVAFVFWNMEEFFSRALSTSMPLLIKEHYTDFSRFIVNIFTGLYRNTEAIPNTDIPSLNNMLKAWFNIYTDLKTQVAGYEKYHHTVLNELLNWIGNYKISALYMGAEWEPTNQPYALVKRLGGRKVILELYQLLSATYVDDYIRDHPLFKMFRESADLICNLVYDVVNLTRVAEGRKFCRNALLSEILKGEQLFETALEKHLLVINNEILDLQKAAKGLAQEFQGVECVEKYVRNTMFHCDGMIRYLLSQDRYGKCDFKVMKVVSISQARF